MNHLSQNTNLAFVTAHFYGHHDPTNIEQRSRVFSRVMNLLQSSLIYNFTLQIVKSTYYVVFFVFRSETIFARLGTDYEIRNL